MRKSNPYERLNQIGAHNMLKRPKHLTFRIVVRASTSDFGQKAFIALESILTKEKMYIGGVGFDNDNYNPYGSFICMRIIYHGIRDVTSFWYF